jgi:hypothetical protein
MTSIYALPLGYLIPLALLAAIGGWYVCGAFMAFMDRLNDPEDKSGGRRRRKSKNATK